MMNYQSARLEHLEAEEAAREEALTRIASLVKRFDLRREDLEAIFGTSAKSEPPLASDYLITSTPHSRTFDPFFDAW